MSPSRRLRFLSVAFIVVLAGLLTASASQAMPLFGFNDEWNVRTLHRAVAVSEQFHANSERVEVWWNGTEPHKGTYYWGYLDRVYQTMEKLHVPPLLDVVSAPHWAIARHCRPIYKCQQTQAHDGDFRVFLRTLVRRYPLAVGIEVGQEPNLTNWSIHPDPRRYAQILKAGYSAVRQVNKHMRVLIGSTCCDTAHGHGNIGASTFLAQLYRYGIKGHYTDIGFHIYPGRAVSLVASDIQSEIGGMRAVRNANRDRSRFWITETGFPSRGVSLYGGGVFNESNQAQREVIAYRTLSAMGDVEALYLFRLIDAKPSKNFANGVNMGIFHSNFRPKRAVAALRHVTAKRR